MADIFKAAAAPFIRRSSKVIDRSGTMRKESHWIDSCRIHEFFFHFLADGRGAFVCLQRLWTILPAAFSRQDFSRHLPDQRF
jgi:hypothetical protein